MEGDTMNISRKELLRELRNWDNTSLMELAESITDIIKENSVTVEINLHYDQFKGSGKCYAARIDPVSRKILDYVEPDRIISQGKYKGEHIYYLLDGYYLLNETGNKAQDYRKYIKVAGGDIEMLYI